MTDLFPDMTVGEPYPHPLFRSSKEVWRCNVRGFGDFRDTIVAGSTPAQALARARAVAAIPGLIDLVDLVKEVRVYGHSGTRHGACANVPEDWDNRARAALRALEERNDL